MPPTTGEKGLTKDTLVTLRFDSSRGRGDFVIQIGIGMLIRGKPGPSLVGH